MNVTMQPSEKEKNIASVKRAIDRKKSEVEDARAKLNDLCAELRGLTIALEAIDGQTVVSGTLDTYTSMLAIYK